MAISRKLFVFFMLGFVSLFADIAYEGARSVLGPYVELFRAAAIVAGALAIGDFIGYVMRLVSGVLVGWLRSSRALWLFTIAGYVVNLVAVPLLALARSWRDVLLLVIIERSGKGLRTPARDVILAEVAEDIGRGKGFGIHELLDQIGAISGPLIVSAMLAAYGYRFAFAVLAIPAVIAIALVVASSLLYPRVRSIEKPSREGAKGLELRFLLYTVAIAMLSMGFLHWSIVSYYLKNASLVSDYVIPLLYTAAMAVDAAIAIPVGWLYDLYGVRILLAAPIAAAAIPPLLAARSFGAIAAASCLWGAVMGMYETIMRAAVADLVEPSKRAYAYGVYNFVFGVSWMGGSLLAGAIYDRALTRIALIMPLLSLAALIPMLAAVRRSSES